MVSGVRIGIDFDNTIIAYDELFCAVAKTCGLIAPSFFGGKQAVRDAIRQLPQGELTWQRLQGEVYGKKIGGATMIPGVVEFLHRCRKEGCAVVIVSHKTEYGHFDPVRINLREAALDWMTINGLFESDYAIGNNNVYFEETRAEKLARVAKLQLSYFIDDLEEVLTDPAFPQSVQRILFAETAVRANYPFPVYSTWRSIEGYIFDRT